MSDHVFNGDCRGGPMDGQLGMSRFANGFLLVDRPGNRMWIYDAKHESIPPNPREYCEFQVRDEEGYELDMDRAWTTGDGLEWDVRTRDDA